MLLAHEAGGSTWEQSRFVLLRRDQPQMDAGDAFVIAETINAASTI